MLLAICSLEGFLRSSTSQDNCIARQEIVSKSEIVREFVKSSGGVFGEAGIATLIPHIKLPHVGLVGGTLIADVVPDHP